MNEINNETMTDSDNQVGSRAIDASMADSVDGVTDDSSLSSDTEGDSWEPESLKREISPAASSGSEGVGAREFGGHVPLYDNGEPGADEKSCSSRGSYALVTLLIVLALFSIGLRAGRDGMPVVKTQSAVAIVNISGNIEFSGAGSDGISFMGGSSAESVIRQLEVIRDMDEVKAVVLRVNSPGGTVGAAQEICAHVDKLRDSGKRVVASMGDVAASGGYYVCTGSDRIFANPGTLTGSIGVLMGGFEASALMEKFGVQDNTVTSGEFKDIGSPYRPMKTGERILVKAMVDDCCDQFLERVGKCRNLSPEQIARFSDGRIMTGRQALDMGLVDTLGGFREAVNAAAALAGIKGSPRIIQMKGSAIELMFQRLTSSLRQGLLKTLLPMRGFLALLSLESGTVR
ncbi:MAG: signal peptide peptidase SppA [Candidatus Wallbacteria bacterium HGW-Wallbacteria-1]|uniref:Signal peptide peptidase SppA n=1 Tax=Candidatus Wallbacteria bacterium HGW-Wallbacteria-1 TaxID=2013854 RepID=A0A2N1PRR1_9BACT|nr:MAG: signal peptide peptidase SppA [Candidatus Wallbacteria bacterium HGW-Wallbacteria-1]